VPTGSDRFTKYQHHLSRKHSAKLCRVESNQESVNQQQG
jgi:hypothetical protein